jgi:hypothetical protein
MAVSGQSATSPRELVAICTTWTTLPIGPSVPWPGSANGLRKKWKGDPSPSREIGPPRPWMLGSSLSPQAPGRRQEVPILLLSRRFSGVSGKQGGFYNAVESITNCGAGGWCGMAGSGTRPAQRWPRDSPVLHTEQTMQKANFHHHIVTGVVQFQAWRMYPGRPIAFSSSSSVRNYLYHSGYTPLGDTALLLAPPRAQERIATTAEQQLSPADKAHYYGQSEVSNSRLS